MYERFARTRSWTGREDRVGELHSRSRLPRRGTPRERSSVGWGLGPGRRGRAFRLGLNRTCAGSTRARVGAARSRTSLGGGERLGAERRSRARPQGGDARGGGSRRGGVGGHRCCRGRAARRTVRRARNASGSCGERASGNGALDGASRCVALRARAGGDATFEAIKKDVHVRRGFDASRAFEDPTVSVSSNRAGYFLTDRTRTPLSSDRSNAVVRSTPDAVPFPVFHSFLRARNHRRLRRQNRRHAVRERRLGIGSARKTSR